LPLYEYKCEKCGHVFEKIEAVGAAETRKCPKCGAKAVRTLSAPAIQFKGSGWYVTDYGGKSTPASSKDGGPSGNGTEKTESKPAAASDDKGSSKKPATKETSGKAKSK